VGPRRPAIRGARALNSYCNAEFLVAMQQVSWHSLFGGALRRCCPFGRFLPKLWAAGSSRGSFFVRRCNKIARAGYSAAWAGRSAAGEKRQSAPISILRSSRRRSKPSVRAIRRSSR